MALFDYFRRNKKLSSEIVKVSKSSPENALFAENVLEIISPAVERFGFQRHITEYENHFITLIFRKATQYIKISGSTHPTDYPHFYNVILGEGDSEEFYEWDWNSIALWQLKKIIAPNAKAKEFAFPYGDNVKFSVLKAKRDLLKYADAFLRGDLALFYKVRSDQNRRREPYRIHTLDGDGSLKTTDEQRSAEQKKKYS